MNKVKIRYKLEGDGVKCRVEVNGYEIANKIQGLTMNLSAGSVPKVVFEVPTTDIEVDIDGIVKGFPVNEIEVETPYETDEGDTWERIKEVTSKISEEIDKQLKSPTNQIKCGEVDEE